ncbi:7326_t:CDS:1, partial [Gigaspora rosea]
DKVITDKDPDFLKIFSELSISMDTLEKSIKVYSSVNHSA